MTRAAVSLTAFYPPAAEGRILSYARHAAGGGVGAVLEFVQRSQLFSPCCDILGATTVPGEVDAVEVRKAMLACDDILIDGGIGEGGSALVLWDEGGLIEGVGVGGSCAWLFRPDQEEGIDLALEIPSKPLLGEGIVAMRTRSVACAPGEVIVAGGHSLRNSLESSAIRDLVRQHMTAGTPDRIAAAVSGAAWSAGERPGVLCYHLPVAQGLPNPWATA